MSASSVPEGSVTGRRPRRAASGEAPPARKARWPLPWRDRGGRFSPLKATALALLFAPAAWVAWLWAADMLGPEPYNAAIHHIGLWSTRFLLISLCVTPLRALLDWTKVLQLRRMLGLAALFYALAHLLLYAADQQFRVLHVALEIVRRTYLTIGFVALLGLVALGWTSTDGWLRRLGRRWKRLHRLVFPIAVLALLHAFIQSKIDVSEAVLMSGLFGWLVLWRLLPGPWNSRFWPVLVLAPAAALLAAGMEYLWYAIATPLPASAVLLANLDVSFGLRPALWVGIAALAAAALPLLRDVAARWTRRRTG